MRASLADEEACQIRDVELASRASSSRNIEKTRGTADSVVADEKTSEGVQIIEVVSSGEQDPPTC